MQFQKISIPTPWKVNGNSEGVGGLQSQNFKRNVLGLKEHGQLVHMRIRYHFIANLHITLHHKTRERRTETEKGINKPCRIEVFANQSSGYIHVTLLEH